MRAPHLPQDEPERLRALRRLGLLDTPSEERFDRITRTARRLFDVPIALVSLVDEARQWFKSQQGLAACETDRDVSFCGHAILGEEALVVEDTGDDARFVDNPLVTGPPDIRFYADQPLHGPTGHRLGTLCIIDTEPRRFLPGDRAALADLGRMVEEELSAPARRDSPLARLDDLTRAERAERVDASSRAWNRTGLVEAGQLLIAECLRSQSPVGIVRWRLPDLAGTDDPLAALEAAQALRAGLSAHDKLGRLTETDFAAVLPGAGDTITAEVVARTIPRLADHRGVEAGCVHYEPGRLADVDVLLQAAEGLLEPCVAASLRRTG